MHIALTRENLDVVKCLDKLGGNATIKNPQSNISPIDIAMIKAQTEDKPEFRNYFMA